jgi:hypothetical protein
MHSAKQPANPDGDQGTRIGLSLDSLAEPTFQRDSAVARSHGGISCSITGLAVKVLRSTDSLIGYSLTLGVSAGAKIPHWKRPNGSVAPE